MAGLKLDHIADAVAANPKAGMELLASEHGTDHVVYLELTKAFEGTGDLTVSEQLQIAGKLLQESDSLSAQGFGRLLLWADSNFRDPPKSSRRGR